MARRKANPPSERPLSRKHVSRAEREAQQRQRVIIGTSIVTVLVTVILLGGLAYAFFVEPGQAMAEVGDETITREQFYKRVNYERFRIFEVFDETRTEYVNSLQDPQTASFMAQFFEQQLGQLAQLYNQIGSQTLETMIEEQLIEREAETRAITVSDAEVDEEIRRQIARQEGAQIAVDVTATTEGRANATATAAQWTPTPTLEATVVPAGEVTGTAALTPTLTPPPTFTPAPTPTPNIIGDDAFEESYQAFLAEMERRTSFSEADFRRVIRLELLREKVREAFTAEVEVEPSEEQVHAAHILVEMEESAEDVLARLAAGESFEALAAELSTDTSNAQQGGDLGWFARGSMVAAFEEAAFALSEPGELSEPVETQFGWHIVKLLEGPEEREKPEATIDQEKEQAWQSFLQERKFGSDVQRFWDVDMMPDDPFQAELQEPLPTPPPIPTTIPVTIEPVNDTGEGGTETE